MIPKENQVSGKVGMAGVSAGLLVETPGFAGCSTGLLLAILGLTFLLLCVSLQIYLSVKSVKSMFYILQYEGLFHKLLELLGVNDGACWKCLCVLVN